ncbi:hypothetical protein GYMLUDRAFT_249752 [Collybiopsis luxurians FD-317 M1]|uniref:Uncharacterized protein n=1 Tax=Collybiopsis luxurians FD-317 M1 TaxID=944289 RepID=A0A0D0CGR8_9AGAR|nr:hypothetical protein GYMLUDRAFT_249752 [Collybiopsis luxurians FD-317 M1]
MAPTKSPRKSPRKPSSKSQASLRKPSAKQTQPKSPSHAPAAKKSRGPQHCKQCPGRPLRTSLDCIHSKAYSNLRKAVLLLNITIPPDASAVHLQALLSCGGADGQDSTTTHGAPIPSRDVLHPEAAAAMIHSAATHGMTHGAPTTTQSSSHPESTISPICPAQAMSSLLGLSTRSPSDPFSTPGFMTNVFDHNGVQYTQVYDPALVPPEYTPAVASRSSGTTSSTSTRSGPSGQVSPASIGSGSSG